ncbi:MAG: DEAD/DEAH box helicase, partial [Thermodesulfobacteriota bacterium]
MSREESLLKSLELLKDIGVKNDSIRAIKHIPAQEGKYCEYPSDVHPALAKALKEKGFLKLYTHQHLSWRLLKEGKNIVVVTPTASGKTLCYNLPVLEAMLKNPSSRAIYLFPTKALSQDQKTELNETIKHLGEEIRIFTYDGDTPQDARKAIRARGHIILTNPDMLHAGILPHHTKWIKLFENLKYIVIDELHNYRGVFGSHLANILRRLKRIAKFYGAQPQFILCTATIANPLEMAEKMTEEPVSLVDNNGAPRGEKYFIFFNPPVVNKFLGIRRSYVNESRRIASLFIKSNLQTIVFAKSRLITEILVTYLKEDIEKTIKKKGLIRGYRGGYLPLKRREIEKGLREGTIKGVISTNALELGIDIGSLDIAVLAGYPGTISSTWQRAGRAGRKTGRSAAVLVASSAPIDQFIINNPDYFFSKNPEKALINPDNLSILVSHIECATFELPFAEKDKFGHVEIGEILKFLEEEKLVHHSKDKWFWTSDAYPADGVSLRSISSDNFVVVDTSKKTRVIAEVDFSSALTTLHPKAIYMCEGDQYFVDKLDYDQRKAYVKKTDVDYFTDAIDYTKIKILDVFDKKSLEKCFISHGEVHVATQVVGFKKIKFYTSENVGAGDLSLPENEMHTTAYWLTIPSEIFHSLPFSTEQKINGLFGVAYLLHHVSPLFMMCDLHDVGASIGDNTTGK